MQRRLRLGAIRGSRRFCTKENMSALLYRSSLRTAGFTGELELYAHILSGAALTHSLAKYYSTFGNGTPCGTHVGAILT